MTKNEDLIFDIKRANEWQALALAMTPAAEQVVEKIRKIVPGFQVEIKDGQVWADGIRFFLDVEASHPDLLLLKAEYTATGFLWKKVKKIKHLFRFSDFEELYDATAKQRYH